MLGAVVRGELALPERKERRRKRKRAGRQLLDGWRQPRLPDGTATDSRSGHRRQHAGALERKARLGQALAHARQYEERLEQPCRPSQQRPLGPE